MSPFNKSDAPLNLPKDTIKLIADSALQAGITLFGGLVGSGKTLTTQAVVERIKKNNNFNPDHVFYINTYEEKEAGRCVKDTVDALVKKHEHEHLLVVLDEVHHEKTMMLALELASNGHSVLGVAQCLMPISLASVLEGALQWASDDIKTAITADLLENLNMVGLQNSLTTYTTCNLTYRDKHDFVALLNEHGMDRVCEELNALAVRHK